MTDFPETDEGFDDQGRAEALDETNFGEYGRERRTFEEIPDVLDVTTADGDRDEDEAVALDADEFRDDALTDGDLEEDDELDYRAASEEREDDIDGLGPEDRFNEDAVSANSIEGLDEVRDAGEAVVGEDDVTDFQASDVSDADLKAMGYSESRER